MIRASSSYSASSNAFTLIESLVMMINLFIITMLVVALVLHQPDEKEGNDLKNWLDKGGDASVPTATWSPELPVMDIGGNDAPPPPDPLIAPTAIEEN